MREHGFETGNGNRTSKTDMRIGTRRFAVKAASLGAKGIFQFNHVRLDRQYDFLLCIGVCPSEIRFAIWRKGAVAEGDAGSLVRMAEGQAVTCKITKRLDAMSPIELLPTVITDMLGLEPRGKP